MGRFWGKNKWKLLHTGTIKHLVWAVSNMGNARKKYVSVERLSSSDIFALLDSVESDDKGDIGNIMIDLDTEFVAADSSVISTNMIRKERLMTIVAPYQFQKHQSTFCLPKTNMKPILYVRMNWIVLLPLNTLPISHLLLPINILPISHLLLLLLGVLPISHPNLLLLLQLLYLKMLKNRSKTRWSKTRWKRKTSMLHPTRIAQTRKRAVPHRTKTKQKRKNRYDWGMEMGG